jgi:hypothetical protein
LPVWVPAARTDGTVEELQIGYAVHSKAGFILHLNPLRVGAQGLVAPGLFETETHPRVPAADPVVSVPASDGKGRGATTLAELERLARRCERMLADPRKARWHEEQRVLLAEIKAELDRKRAERPSLG